ncbi:steroid delta-isomerase [Pseudomonas sp. ok272]|uniref:nuclear transport factor 2 family protein n=1 Tax=unclassified Pseudomonas TaxID=196821 RepID=UPI0008D2D8D9|nr:MULTISPECIES: nuclear transport factor 2 family protein [unclassified Pseudomonas]SEN42768.1 steroid delta-isomerase [Pseudomonas sp. ok272]SFN25620.1 steroid delta-isomerase [Pseudomonas sp. ok602]
MPSQTQIKNALQAYIDAFNRNDLQTLIALYHDDATVEDPYGTPPRQGKAQIVEFYRGAMANGATLQLCAPIRGSHGDAGAMAFDAVVKLPQGEARVRVIDVMTFDDAGLITTMRAYFGPGDIEVNASTDNRDG